MTSLRVKLECLVPHLPLDLSILSPLQQLRELHLEYSPSEGHETETTYGLDWLPNLQRLKLRAGGVEWMGLLEPLAHISGLLDLDMSCPDAVIPFSYFSSFVHLTRLSVSDNREGLEGLGCTELRHISNLRELQELHLVTDRWPQIREEEMAAIGSFLSSLSLLTSLTLKHFSAEGIRLFCPALLERVQTLGLQHWHCSQYLHFAVPMQQCLGELSAAKALRSLDLSEMKLEIGSHLSMVSSCQQLTFLDVSHIDGQLESQHLHCLSELQFLVELRLGSNRFLDESVLTILNPLGCLRSLDVSDSRWLKDTGLYHIAGLLGLSKLNLSQSRGITVRGVVEMISRNCGALISVTVPGRVYNLSGLYDNIEHKLRGPVGACIIDTDY